MEISLTCAWCDKKIPDDAEVFALGAKIKADYFQLAKQQAGQLVDFHLFTVDKDVPVVISAPDSDAKKEGKDLLFPTCSLKCGKALKATLRKEEGIAETMFR